MLILFECPNINEHWWILNINVVVLWHGETPTFCVRECLYACVCVCGQWCTGFPWEHSSGFPLTNWERGWRPVGWEEEAEAEEDRLCERRDEWVRLNWMKPSLGLRCCKQGGNLKRGPFLIESLCRTQLPLCLLFSEHHLLTPISRTPPSI